MTALLETQHLTMKFGGLTAVSDFNFSIAPGELLGLIGPNGAGKTTVFNMLTGIYKPTEGTWSFDGRAMGHTQPHAVTARGICRTFQNIRLFRDLSVLDNVRIAMHQRAGAGFWRTVLQTAGHKKNEKSQLERALQLLERLDLAQRQNELAKNLPYGDQRRLEIARALATQPKLLLLDEPAAGMNPQETTALSALIARLRTEFRLAILLIEHDMKVVMGVCECIYVLNYGATIAVGTPAQVQNDPAVITAYLGEPGK